MKQSIVDCQKKFVMKRMLTSLSLLFCFSWMMSPAAMAVAVANRSTVDDPPPNTRGRSAGSRGCSAAANNIGQTSSGQTSSGQTSEQQTAQAAAIPALILLTPEDATGGLSKTISTQPTFVWFSRAGNQAAQGVFRLYEYDAIADRYQLLVESEGLESPSASGIVVASLAADMPELTVGSQYLWQVELVCDPNRPSGALFAEAVFEVTSPPATLARQLAAAPSPADKAAMLAAEDLWYDALPLALANETRTSEAATLRSVREAAFEQVAFSPEEQTRLAESRVYRMEIE